MNQHSKIEQQVMAGVGVVYTARRLSSPLAIKLYALALSVVGLVVFVSLPHVAANFMNVARGGVGSIEGFALTAVLRTTIVVQLALGIGIFAIVSLLSDVVRSVSHPRGPRGHAQSVAA